MYSIRQFFLCFLSFNFYGFFSSQENIVSANIFPQDDSNLLSSIPEVASTLLATKFKTAIGATKFIPNCFKPLTIFTALDETCLVNQTTQSLDVRVVSPVTVGSITGGMLGDDIYEIDHFDFYWQNSLCNVTHNLEAQVYFFDLKYKTFENAQDYPEGVSVLNFPISTNGDIPNWKFNAFSKILGSKIKEPGDYLDVHSAFTYTWFVNFPYGSIYHTYRKKFTDSNSGKKYIANVIDLPLDPRINYISNDQFKNTFGKIKRVSEAAMTGAFVHDESETSKVRHKGICVIDLPA